MYAVIQLGSSQFKVSEGDVIQADRSTEEKGKKLMIDKVLLFANGDDVRVGQPYVDGVKISAEVVDHVLGSKMVAFTYRRRKDSSKKKGHRQKHTSIAIKKISA